MLRSNVVYKITCSQCNLSYVGQTSRHLQQRFKEHIGSQGLLKKHFEDCNVSPSLDMLYIAFIDLTKAFDLVSRDGLFKLLPKIGCPPGLFNIIRSFHEGMQGTVQYDGN